MTALPSAVNSLMMPSAPPINSDEPETPPGVQLRKLDDPAAVRRMIYDRTLQAVQKLPPLTNQRYTMRITDPHYEPRDSFSLREQKKAVLTRQTLGRRLRGNWELVDNASGEVMQRQPTVLATVPFFSDRGTFILNGNETTLANQMRLRPGVFSRVKDNGELESHVNIMPGKGVSHHIFLDPKTGIFRMQVAQAKLPLLPILRALGATDAQIREAWGRDLAAQNMQKAETTQLDKIYKKILPNRLQAGDEGSRQKALGDFMRTFELDPEVTKRTLGKPYERVDADQVLDTTKKLLAISKGEAEPDDRDHLAYMKVFGPEDLIAERVTNAQKAMRLLLWKVTNKSSLDPVPSGYFNKAIQAAIVSSGLGQPLESINPSQVHDQQGRLTRLGVGAIESPDSIPDSSRSVQPSHFGYIDPISTPECYDEKTEVLTKDGWRFWPDVHETDEFACLIGGYVEFHQASKLVSYPYSGPMYGASSRLIDYLVTPNHRMWTKPQDVTHATLAWRFENAAYTHERPRRFLCGGAVYRGQSDSYWFELPEIEKGGNAQKEFRPFKLTDWCEFLGWYLAEGSFHWGDGHYFVNISQSRDANLEHYARIAALLSVMGLPFSYDSNDRGFTIHGKQLTQYMRQFGYSQDRHIPPEFFHIPVEARCRMLEALKNGDGRRNRRGERYNYSSVSKQLADDVQFLAFSLGISSRISIEPDDRQPQYQTNYVVNFHDRTERILSSPGGPRTNHYVKVDYSGQVYCATVPGGLLYVRRNNSTGMWCGNSLSIGVDLRVASGARKGDDGRLYSLFRDKRGKMVYKSAQDVADATIAFPGSLKSGSKWVPTLSNGKLKFKNRSDVDYEIPTMESTFGPVMNLVPMKSAMHGQRAAMASRMITQALPLVEPEAPLVQSAGENGRSMEEEYGEQMGALRSNVDGHVVSSGDGKIVIKDAAGKTHQFEYYENFPNNTKSARDSIPVVRPGQRVVPGDLLTRSNYTTEKGVAALGRNARVAFMPYKGFTFEDAYGVSESFAKKLNSQQVYQLGRDLPKTGKAGKTNFVAIFPKTFDRQQLEKMDDSGVVKLGTTVNPGDPLVLFAEERAPSRTRVHKARAKSFSDGSETWDHEAPGVVTDVERTKNGVTVVVKSTQEAHVADKISNRFGGKGVITIIPDEEMPKDAEGNPFEVLVNPLTMISRRNPAQIMETLLGKIAAKTGEPYKIKDFDEIKDLRQYVLDELKKNDTSMKDTVYDGSTGRPIKNVLTGNMFFMKLHHLADAKAQGRALDSYTADETPAKGGPTGAKKVGLLQSMSLISHGASDVLNDIGSIRGQKQEKYWQQYMAGFKPPTPEVPLMYRKFVNYLKGSGINVVRHGTRTNLMAMTDADVENLAGDREIKSADTLDWKSDELRPIKGGLFDESATGGPSGKQWSHVKLPEPMPNPVFEDPIRHLLGLTKNQFQDVLAGKEELNGERGPQAFAKALDGINLDRAIEQARQDVSAGRKGLRDSAVRRLGYLRDAKRLGIHPRSWMMSRVPVLPPIFRPVSMMQLRGGKETPLIADPNYLYKELLDAKDAFGLAKQHFGDVSDERTALYNSFKAVTGLGDPTHPKNQERRVRGLLAHVFGNSPKHGMVQSRLIGRAVDLVGRAVITPDSDLDMDSIGIPESKAWDIYKPFITRRLVRAGMPSYVAADEVEKQSDRARRALAEELSVRPVIANRDPVLHRYGVMAFWPQLTKDNSLHMPPLAVAGFGADFDGDAMQFHVPASDDAVKEATEKMLPSRNLLSTSDFQAHQLPGKEFLAGLYLASRAADPKKPPATFRSNADAIAAYRAGEIDADQEIRILQPS